MSGSCEAATGGPCDGPELTFADPNLEAAVRDALGIQTGPIDPAIAASLSSLSATGRGIVDLSGIECLTGLNGLFIATNRITDLGPVGALPSIWRLVLTSNPISDLSPIATRDIRFLDITNTQVTDLAPLGGMTNLISFTASNTALGDRRSVVGGRRLQRISRRYRGSPAPCGP